jgi:phosphohistidine phosphatase
MSGRAMNQETGLLVIVRHGEAEPDEVDPARPLTSQGRQDVERLAACLATADLTLQRIVHSDKLRARQTAQILQRHLAADLDAVASDGLHPNDDVGFAVDLADHTAGASMIVGHLPHLERVIDSLLSGRLDTRIVELQAGAAAVLARRPHGWTLRALIQPDLLPNRGT